MLDLRYLVNNYDCVINEYTTPNRANAGSSTSIPGRDQVWTKPNGVTWIYMLVMGAGGGGNAGGSGASGTSRGGGGGGGGGALLKFLVPAVAVPNSLIMCPGLGGTQNNSGGKTKIILQGSLYSFNSAEVSGEVYLVADGGGVGSAGNGSTGAGGAGGPAGSTISVIGGADYGIWMGKAGGTGGAGGTTSGSAGAVGANAGTGAGVINSGGAGGAAIGTDNVAYNGGNVTSPYNTNAGGTTAGDLPTRGHILQYPYLLFHGGAGGASVNGVAQAGAQAAPGCGGGGGGAGTTGGGAGTGGHGYILVICW